MDTEAHIHSLLARFVERHSKGVIIWEFQGDESSMTLVYANPAMRKVNKVDWLDSVGKRCADFFPAFMETEYPEIFFNLLRSQNVVRFIEDHGEGDEAVLYKCVVVPLSDTHIGVVFSDMAKEHQLKQGMLRNIKALQDATSEALKTLSNGASKPPAALCLCYPADDKRAVACRERQRLSKGKGCD